MGSKFILEAAGSTSATRHSQDPTQAVDVGGYREMAVIVDVIATVSGGTLTFETAIEPFEGAFVDLGASFGVDLGTPGRTLTYLTGFARYLRWNTSGITAEEARFTIDGYAKLPG